jgi:WD40 repeat protein
MPFRLVLALCLCSIVRSGGGEEVSFRRDVAPLLLDNCLACHGAKKAEGGYRVDSFDRLIKEGDSGLAGVTSSELEDSELWRRLASEDADERMPFEADPLPAAQLELVRRWIEEGAKFDADEPTDSLISIIPPRDHPAPPESYQYPIPIVALTFSNDGSELFVGGYHEVTVWDPGSGKLLRRISNIGQRTRALALRGDGQILAVGCGAPGKLGETRLVQPQDGTLLRVLGTTSDEVLDVVFRPDGKVLAIAAADGILRVFDADTGALQRVITSHSDWITSVAWNADGTRLASSSRDKTSKVFDAESGELLVTYSGHNQPVQGVAFHPEGKEVYSSGADKKIHRWKVEDAAKVAEVGFGGEVFKLPQTGEFLFAASADKTVRQFEAASHKELRSFAGHEDWALSVAYHPATNRVASGGFDGRVIVWNLEDGKQIASFMAAPGLSSAK